MKIRTVYFGQRCRCPQKSCLELLLQLPRRTFHSLVHVPCRDLSVDREILPHNPPKLLKPAQDSKMLFLGTCTHLGRKTEAHRELSCQQSLQASADWFRPPATEDLTQKPIALVSAWVLRAFFPFSGPHAALSRGALRLVPCCLGTALSPVAQPAQTGQVTPAAAACQHPQDQQLHAGHHNLCLIITAPQIRKNLLEPLPSMPGKNRP